MKILGGMTTWNNFEFFKYSLKQALDFCDEVIVVEGCHSRQYPKHSTDGTVEYLNSLKHSKLKVLDFDYKKYGLEGKRYDLVQCKIWNLINSSFKSWKPGNWLVRWDDDRFWFKKDLEKVRDILKTTKQDRVNFRERFFTYNFRFNLIRGPGHRFDRITEGCFYTPIVNLCYENSTRYQDMPIQSEIIVFHYTSVKKSERMNARWIMSVEKGTESSRTRFKKWMNIKWKNDDDFLKYRDTIAFILGGDPSNVNIYNGKHPEVLDSHPWRYIEDIRKIK